MLRSSSIGGNLFEPILYGWLPLDIGVDAGGRRDGFSSGDILSGVIPVVNIDSEALCQGVAQLGA